MCGDIMKCTIDVWYPYGSTEEIDFKQYLSDLPEGLKTKDDLAQHIQDTWNKSVFDWFDFDELEISCSIQISDEEFEQYKDVKNNDPFDIWAKGVRESRERRENV